MQTSLLLMFYLLATSGLGIFWVAHQQLPVFDWHYLFGYGTLLLVGIHLFFNLPPLVRTLKKRSQRGQPSTGKRTTVGKKRVGLVLLLGLCGLSFYAGSLMGVNDVKISWTDGTELVMGPVDAVIDYHTFSSESSEDVFKRSPGIEWTGANAEFKAYSGPTISLPEPVRESRSLSEALGPLPKRVEPLSLDVISSILFHAAGVTDIDDGYNLRAAPSSGALAPTEVYLHTDGFPGVSAGTYYYHPLEHHLALISTDAKTDGTHMYITSVFQRTGKKYEDRAYRYAVADAGHIMENLRLAAAEYGYAAQPLTHFDEAEIQDALELDGIQEGVLADILLTKTWRTLPSADWSYLEPPTDTGLGVTGIAQHATSLRRMVINGQSLPAPSVSTQGLFDTIRSRRSRRRFSEEALSLEDLSALLKASRGPGNFLTRSLILRVVVDRVEGLEPGVYRYLPDTHTLRQERSGDFMPDAYETTFSQDAVGEGAVAFVFSTDRRLTFT